VLSFMSKKLRGRIKVINGKPEALLDALEDVLRAPTRALSAV